MCEIQVGHPSYHHWRSSRYTRSDQGCSAEGEEEEGTITTYPRGWEASKDDYALLEKKIEDLSDLIYTLEQRINEEHVYRKGLQRDLNALNHFVVKMK